MLLVKKSCGKVSPEPVCERDLFWIGRSEIGLVLQSIYWSEKTGCDLLLEIARPVVSKTYLVRD